MNFHVLEIFHRSATFELENQDCYRLPGGFEILLNGELVRREDRNVFTVENLEPDTEYTLQVRAVRTNETAEQQFHTTRESVCLDVRSFGAVPDGITDNTYALQAAIAACPADGTVRVPAGTYLTRPLFLKSHITLQVDEGATLLGDPDRTHYPILPGMTRTTDEQDEYNLASWEGNPLSSFASLIMGIDVEDVNLVGSGVIDGNAPAGDWWKNPKVKRIAWRPNTVYLCRCNRIRMQNLTVQNSPCWTIHPYYSENLSFLNLQIRNPSDSPNTDGLDPESCKNVKILGTVISVGDDCIAIKSGKIYMAFHHHKVTEDVIVRNCLLERGHGSVTIGSEAAGGVSGVIVDKCLFDRTDRGLRIKTRRGRGKHSVLDRIEFRNIRMTGVKMPFTVNMFYFCDPDGHTDYVQNQEAKPVDDRTPAIGSITARNITCEGVDASVLCCVGLPEAPVRELVLENIEATFLPEAERTPAVPVMMDGFEPVSGRGVIVKNAEHVSLKNIRLHGSVDTEAELVNVSAADLEGLEYLPAAAEDGCVITCSGDSGAEASGVQLLEQTAVAAGQKSLDLNLGAGTYACKLYLDQPEIRIQGAGRDQTILTWDDGAAEHMPDGTRRGTFRSYTAFLGGSHCEIRDLTIRNTAGEGDLVGQALALYADSETFVAENCSFEGCQDTLFMAPLPESEKKPGGFTGPGEKKLRRLTTQLYRNCRIVGNVDFIFGGADAVFENCEIVLMPRRRKADPDATNAAGEGNVRKVTRDGRHASGFVAAPCGRADRLGMVFRDCTIRMAKPEEFPYLREQGEPLDQQEAFFLGRPWREEGRCVYLNCKMDDSIANTRFSGWTGEEVAEPASFMAEYGTTNLNGEQLPAAQDQPGPAVHKLTADEAARLMRLADGLIRTVGKEEA